MFFVELTYKAPLSEVDRHLEAHRKFLEKGYADRVFVFSGRKVPRDGGVFLVRVASRSDVDSLIHQDPFYQNALADYRIIEFSPTLFDEAFGVFVK